VTDETHEDLTLLAEWELRRDLQKHIAAERERIQELAALTHLLEKTIRERDEARDNLDFLMRCSRTDIAVLRKMHHEEVAKLTAEHERGILAIWHEATDAIHPPATVEDVIAAVRKLRQERNAANRAEK